MVQMMRWLVASGVAVDGLRWSNAALAGTSRSRCLRLAALLLASGWVLSIVDALVPVMTAAPFGLLAFIATGLVSAGAAIAVVVIGVALVTRELPGLRGGVGGATGRAAVGALVIAVGALSGIAERVLGLVAAVRG